MAHILMLQARRKSRRLLLRRNTAAKCVPRSHGGTGWSVWSRSPMSDGRKHVEMSS